MSTVYIVLHPEITPEFEEDGMLKVDDSWEEDKDYTPIGSSWGFLTQKSILVEHLPDKIPIFAFDNNTELKTLGELRKYYKHH